jgi:pimeloyl-ACP methyl ester carboxylesterase
MTTHHTLDVGDAVLAYDVREGSDGRPPLLLIGQPMTAEGFGTLSGLLPGRTLVTYDPRGLGRSTRTDGRVTHEPATHVDDLHALVTGLGRGPVEVFASSGGAVDALAWLAAHPGDVTTLVAHEPPLLTVLPDAEHALAAEAAVQAAYHRDGWGAGMAAFVALTTWQGEFTDAVLAVVVAAGIDPGDPSPGAPPRRWPPRSGSR